MDYGIIVIHYSLLDADLFFLVKYKRIILPIIKIKCSLSLYVMESQKNKSTDSNDILLTTSFYNPVVP